MTSIDETFLSLPRTAVADAALSRARELGAEHADVRIVRTRTGRLDLRDGRLDSSSDVLDAGLAVRVIVDGVWGFASTAEITPQAASRSMQEAVHVASVCRDLVIRPVALAPEPVHTGEWTSAYDINPFDVAEPERIGLLTEWSQRLLANDGVDHVDASVEYVQENTFYADLAGTSTTQQRVRLMPELTVTNVDRAGGGFETMRSIAPPAGRGWEFLTGTGWDVERELSELPQLLAERTKAPSVTGGPTDLVIDPSNLWLTIHESIGHATELDRALGYEAAYAGTSFATPDKLGTLRYGSDVMNVTGDRTVAHGLATVGWDDDGVEAQRFDIVRDGTLVGYQVNREIAAAGRLARSNGCAYADSAGHIPLQRMANVSLQPQANGPSTDELIGRVEHGLYVVGDKSWSIDMQRYNFQFTAQRFYRIENGRLAGQVRDAAYQATTTDFWGAMEAVGGPDTYVLGGAFNCGKGQPGQIAPVSHGCPSALFRGINVLNTVEEGGR